MKHFFIFLSLFLSLVLVLSLAGCVGQKSTMIDAEQGPTDAMIEGQEGTEDMAEDIVADDSSGTEAAEENAAADSSLADESVEDVKETTVEQPVLQMSAQLKSLLDKAEGLRPNFEYFYYDPSRGKLEYEHKVYLNKQLVRLPYSIDDQGQRFNYILFDNDAMTADAYCTYPEPYQCPGGRGPFELKYSEWHQPTIQDWIKDIGYAEMISDGHVSSTRTKVIKFEKEGHSYLMDIDYFYGLPLKIVIDPDTEDEVVHLFNEVIVAKLKEPDVLPPLPKEKP